MGWPAPLTEEGEFIGGHLGRLRRWCGASDFVTIQAVLESRHAARSNLAADWVTAVADDLSIDSYGYVESHSMLPLTLFFNDKLDVRGRAIRTWPTHKKFRATATPKPCAAFCASCIDEQLQNRPFGIWRRADQLPFRFQCPKHVEPLCISESAEAFMQDPVLIQRSANWRRKEVPQHWIDAPYVQSLDAMTEAMLLHGHRWSHSAVLDRLCFRANRRSMRNIYTDTGPLLSDLLLERFPNDFLCAEFPAFVEKVTDEPLNAIDNIVLTRIGTYSTIALAMTVLYRSPKDAIADLKVIDRRKLWLAN